MNLLFLIEIFMVTLSVLVNFNLNNPLAQTSTPNNQTYQFIKKWGSNGTGNGQFDSPINIAIDSADNVYITDMWDNRVQKFDSSGNFVTKWTQWNK